MQALGQSFQSASPIRFPARLESYLAETKRNWNIRLDKFATLARLLCTTAQRRPAFLAKLLYGYRNYWFWENGDRLGTSLGKARPSCDVQLLSKTGEAGKSCARDRLSCSIGHTAGCSGFCECAVSRCPMGRSKGCTLRRRRDERENPHQLREFGPRGLEVGLKTS